MRSYIQWLIAFLFALGLHLLAFSSVLSMPQSSSENEGERGIEIDLGMLGDLGIELNSPVEDEVEIDKEVIPETENTIEPEEKPSKEEIDDSITKPINPLPKIVDVIEKKNEIVTIKKQPNNQAKQKKPQQKKIEQTSITPSSTTDKKKVISKKQLTTGTADAVSTGGNPGAERSYFSRLAAKLARHKHYPSRARKKSEEGVVTLFFIVSRNGKIIESRISKSSGFKRLDDAVLKMLRKASPLPRFPDEMNQEQLSINIPIEFKLKDAR